MERLTFSANEILTDFDVDESSIVYSIDNDFVRITINVDSQDNLILVHFYNQTKNPRKKGITRCALLLLLEKILESNPRITRDTTLTTMKPTPADGDLVRLVGIYQSLGLTIIQENPPLLRNTIGTVIDTLTPQCHFIDGALKKRSKRALFRQIRVKTRNVKSRTFVKGNRRHRNRRN